MRRPKDLRPRLTGRERHEVVPPLVEVRLMLPPVLVRRLRLVRALTGDSVAEQVRRALWGATDARLTQEGARLWLRPGSRIYRLGARGGGGAMVAEGMGGERVLILRPVTGLPRCEGPDGTSGHGYVADVVHEDDVGPRGGWLRGVVVHREDVVPWSVEAEVAEGPPPEPDEARRARILASERIRREDVARRRERIEEEGERTG